MRGGNKIVVRQAYGRSDAPELHELGPGDWRGSHRLKDENVASEAACLAESGRSMFRMKVTYCRQLQASKPGNESRVRRRVDWQQPDFFANFRTAPLGCRAEAAIKPAATSAIHADINSIEADPIESAKSYLFDTSSWGAFCDVTLTLKQAASPTVAVG